MLTSSDFVIYEFQITYKTKEGENVYILGDHENFGNWVLPKFKLCWCPGHLWKYQTILPRNFNMIQYKFVIIDKEGNKTWEDGPNRVLCTAKTRGLKELKPRTYLISAIWNHFTISFNIYYPLKDGFDSINIVGAPKPLGNWLRKGEEPIQMKLSEKKTITARDGSKVEECF
jgi:hypothetical protein